MFWIIQQKLPHIICSLSYLVKYYCENIFITQSLLQVPGHVFLWCKVTFPWLQGARPVSRFLHCCPTSFPQHSEPWSVCSRTQSSGRGSGLIPQELPLKIRWVLYHWVIVFKMLHHFSLKGLSVLAVWVILYIWRNHLFVSFCKYTSTICTTVFPFIL